MPDTQPPAPSDRHLEQLLPVKRIFGDFFCNRKKSLASDSAAGGETAFEVEVKKGADSPARCFITKFKEPIKSIQTINLIN